MTKDDIRNYLATHGLTYTWVADNLGVSKHTVRGWFSSRRVIPTDKHRRIEEHVTAEMRRREQPENHIGQGIVAFLATDEVIEKIKELAGKKGVSVERWVLELI